MVSFIFKGRGENPFMVSFIFKGRDKVYGYLTVLFWNRVCLCAFWTAVSYHFKTMYF